MNPQIAINYCGGGRIEVSAPYSPALINRFRELQGKWEKPFWVFPDSAALRVAFSLLWGTHGEPIESRRYDVSCLTLTGGQVMLGGYVIVSNRNGKVQHHGIRLVSGDCSVSASGGVNPTADFAFDFDVPRDFAPTTANLTIVPIPPPKGGKKFPSKKPALATPAPAAPSAASIGNIIDLDEMDRIQEKEREAKLVITLVLAMLEDGTVDARTVQQRCREWMGWEREQSRELCSVTMHGVPVGFEHLAGTGTPKAGPVGAPVRSFDPMTAADPLTQLKAMYG